MSQPEVNYIIEYAIKQAIHNLRKQFGPSIVYSISLGTLVGLSYSDMGPVATIAILDRVKEELKSVEFTVN